LGAKLHHIHLRAPDPRKTAKWWSENFGTKILGETESRGVLFVRMDLEGVLINVTAVPADSKPRKGYAGIQYGLEHFGLTVTDLAKTLDSLAKKGVKIQQGLTQTESGAKIAFIEAPDDVRVELLQPA